jgi:hypothetical protein
VTQIEIAAHRFRPNASGRGSGRNARRQRGDKRIAEASLSDALFADGFSMRFVSDETKLQASVSRAPDGSPLALADIRPGIASGQGELPLNYPKSSASLCERLPTGIHLCHDGRVVAQSVCVAAHRSVAIEAADREVCTPSSGARRRAGG